MAWPTFTIEAAFATAPLVTPTWTDISAYLVDLQTVRGRSSALDTFQPGECILRLSNIDRRFDPEHTPGPYYGNLKSWKRVRVKATLATLDCSGAAGSYATTPDHADLDITGDIDIRARVAADDWTPTSVQAICGKWSGASSQLSYILYVESSGVLTLGWSANGTAGIFKSSTVAPTVTNGSYLWVRATLDVDNGAAGNDVRFYTSSEGVTWTQLGSTVTTAGTTSIHSGTVAFVIGANSDLGERFAGLVEDVQVYAGIAGTMALDADFRGAQVGASSIKDRTGKTVTVNSPAAIVANTTSPYPLFDGFVDDGGWAQQYAPPGDAWCEVRLVDALGALGSVQLQDSWAYAASVPTSLVAWYPFDKDSDGGEIFERTRGSHGQWRGSSITTAPAVNEKWAFRPLTDVFVETVRSSWDEHSVSLYRGGATESSGGVLGPSAFKAFKSGVWSAGFLFVCRPSVKTTRVLLSGGHSNYSGTGPAGISIQLVNGRVGFSWGQGVGSGYLISAVRVDDGRPHAVVACRNSTNTKFFLDGVQVGTEATHLDVFDKNMNKMIIGDDYYDESSTDRSYDEIIDELVVYDSYISNVDAERLSGVPLALNELTGSRIGRLLDQIGWPTGATWRDIDAGATLCELQPLNAVTLGDALHMVEATEQGWVFVTADGIITFKQRGDKYLDSRMSTVQWVFTDKAAVLGSGTQRRYNTPSYERRATVPATVVTVEWPQGGAIRKTDTTALGMPRSASTTTLVLSTHEANNIAEWQLLRRSTQRTEITVALSPHADNTLWHTALGLRLLDRVTIERHPQNTGSSTSITGLVQSVEHRATGGWGEWETVIVVSDAELYPVEAVWGTDVWDTGKWGW